MKFLLFDTSANGKPVSYSASSRDTSNWPRMLHLNWQIIDENGKISRQRNDLIKPRGFKVSPQNALLHKLSVEDLEQKGVELKESIQEFMKAVTQVDMVFAHNLALNQGIVTAEADRCGEIERLSSEDAYCLMQESTYYCAIPGKRGKYKWPSLTELHQRIFGKSYQNAGNAEADVNALARCFIVMYKTNVLEDIFD